MTGSQPPLRRKALIWPWVVAALLLTCGAGGFGVYAVAKRVLAEVDRRTDERSGLSSVPLAEARAGHAIAWVDATPPVPRLQAPAEPPADGPFRLVRYRAPLGENSAYLTPDPGDGARHPAVVWAKGGFGGIGEFLWTAGPRKNDQSALAFVREGLVVMCPSWRGENDNPGRFESFYGEVDDLLAAVRHVKALPWVDPQRVYLAGHSTGGTLVLLAAVSSGEFRAAFSFGGAPDMVAVMKDGEGYGNAPYPPGDQTENELRSALRFTPFLERPTFYIEGQESAYPADAARMERLAKKKGVPFRAFAVAGTHFDILAPLTKLVARKMAADTGTECTISLTHAELSLALQAMPLPTLSSVLADWQAGRGPLGEQLARLGEELDPPTERDRAALLGAVAHAIRQGGEPAADDVLALVDVWERLPDQEPAAPDSRAKAEPFVLAVEAWVATRAQEQPEGEAAKKFLRALAFLSRHPTDSTALTIVTAARRAVGADQPLWRRILAPSDDALAAALVTEFGKELPPPVLVGAVAAAANSVLLSAGEGSTLRHPLDSPEGAALLAEWLKAPPLHDQAYTAAVSLALVSRPIHDRLIATALSHPDADVALEAAWADARHGGKAGLAALQKAALDENQSVTAVRYLRELKLDAEIPPAALEPPFAARAEMIAWLAHPQELGAPPKTLVVHDTRELYWPPVQEKRTLWLFRFTYPAGEGKPDATGYGLVGSGATWSFFDDEGDASAEDLYVKHCRHELEHRGEDEEGGEVSLEDARAQLERGNPGSFPPKAQR